MTSQDRPEGPTGASPWRADGSMAQPLARPVLHLAEGRSEKSCSASTASRAPSPPRFSESFRRRTDRGMAAAIRVAAFRRASDARCTYPMVVSTRACLSKAAVSGSETPRAIACVAAACRSEWGVIRFASPASWRRRARRRWIDRTDARPPGLADGKRGTDPAGRCATQAWRSDATSGLSGTSNLLPAFPKTPTSERVS